MTQDPMVQPSQRPRGADRTVVLLVDDQPIVAAAIRKLIAGEPNLDLHYCGDPGQAMEQANQLMPTVILQDLVMPVIDGLELLKMFRNNPSTAETPIVVLSANDDARMKSLSFDSGASDYLVKLPEQIELVARIRYHSAACLNQRRRNEVASALFEAQRSLADRVAELQSARADLEAANARLEKESFLDSLTGTLNRRGLEHQLLIELRRARRESVPLFAALVDCDNFKSVNDTEGHDAGDVVLSEVARRLSSAVRVIDHVARVGGDEFLILLVDAKPESALTLGERIRASVSDEPIVIGSGARQQTISVSVFEVPAEAQSTTAVLACGTGALHTSKRQGKNRVSAAIT
jgi:two-component system, chemotaxis family, response regulator WspR